MMLHRSRTSEGRVEEALGCHCVSVRPAGVTCVDGVEGRRSGWNWAVRRLAEETGGAGGGFALIAGRRMKGSTEGARWSH